MLFYVYIIYSQSLDRYYIGQTQNLQNRLFRHTNSGNKSTKTARDWKLVYQESLQSRAEAVQKEAEIKRKKSRKYIEWFITRSG